MMPVRRRIIIGETYTRQGEQYELSFEVAGGACANPVLSVHYTTRVRSNDVRKPFFVNKRMHDHFPIASDEEFQELLRTATSAGDDAATARFKEYARTHGPAPHHEPRPGV